MKPQTMTKSLEITVQELLSPGKGILAADESIPTIEKRFKAINVPSTDESRRAYREMLFTAPGLSQFISGVILFDETLRQQSHDGMLFPELLANSAIVPGIKVDRGTTILPNFPDETITAGLDGLRERFADYARSGARFAKWRAVIHIGEKIPSSFCLAANAHALARYAALAQEAGLVPIVEPEVLRDGAHDLDRCYEVTRRTLQTVFGALLDHRVMLEGVLLKPNMITPGKEFPVAATPPEVADATMRCLRECVPATVPGIVFLSGGQTEEEATANLNALNQLGEAPWVLSFSFGRALQNSAMQAWRGNQSRAHEGQRALLHRAELSSAAQLGKYDPAMESGELVSR